MTLSKHHIKSILFVALYGMTQAYAVNIERGKELHDGYCISCHASMLGGDGTAIYTRVERRIDSMEALQHQVRRCKTSLGASWPDDQVEDLLEYLNQTFYKFSATLSTTFCGAYAEPCGTYASEAELSATLSATFCGAYAEPCGTYASEAELTE